MKKRAFSPLPTAMGSGNLPLRDANRGRILGIRTIIFDWDGTLARTLDLWVQGFHAAFARRDLHFPTTFIIAEFFHEHHKVAARHPQLDFHTVAEEARTHVRDGIGTVALYAGAAQALQDASALGMSLALVTSSPRAVVTRGLSAHDLTGAFASVIAGDDGFDHKPDTRPLTQTLARLTARPDETMVIGDSHVDILAGQAAGCRTCWYTPQHNRLFHDFTRLEGLGADHRLAD